MRDYKTPGELFLVPKKGGGAYNVLLCEDKEINQMMAIYILEGLGCKIDIANNGEEAINLATSRNYDIIFMDCAMPKIDGYEATVRIRKTWRNQGKPIRTPVIALTAKVMLEDRQKCMESGMDDYIPKPIKREIICNTINKWCSEESNIVFLRHEW